MTGFQTDRPRPHFLIADDHAIFAESLRLYLEKKYTVIGLVDNGRSLVEEALRLRPDVAIVDIGMPLLNGIDAARRIRRQAPNIRLVFLTMHDDPNLAAAALDVGPVAFVLKHSAGTELFRAIDYVLHDKAYLTSRLRAEDWVAAREQAQQFSKELSPRQREVVQLFAEGRPSKQIADILNVSEKTVEYHKHQVMQFFNPKNNADLVLFALRYGLICA